MPVFFGHVEYGSYTSKKSWSLSPPSILQMKMLVVVDFLDSQPKSSMSSKNLKNLQNQVKPPAPPHPITCVASTMRASPRNVIIPTPPHHPMTCVASTMCASPRNYLGGDSSIKSRMEQNPRKQFLGMLGDLGHETKTNILASNKLRDTSTTLYMYVYYTSTLPWVVCKKP